MGPRCGDYGLCYYFDTGVAMKVGDLVTMPNAVDYTLRKKCQALGLIVDDNIVRNRIGVMWPDSDEMIDYEPVKWLKVVSYAKD